MSFGVGFGDIVRAIELSKELVKNYRTAPQEVSELATGIAGLLGVLEEANRVLNQPGLGLTDHQKKTLRPILEGYTSLLNKLQVMYSKYHPLDKNPLDKSLLLPQGQKIPRATHGLDGLRSQACKLGRRFEFDPKDVKECLGRIILYEVMLASFLVVVNTTISSDARREIKTLVDFKSSQEHEDLLKWLTTLDFGELHTNRLQKRVSETGTWFTSSEKFKTWLDHPQTTLLCPGMPGAGKSFMASIAIAHLQDKFLHDQEVGVGFLLCDFNSQHEQCPEDLLASLLKQLVQCRPAPPNLQEMFERYKSKPPGSRPLVNELLNCLTTVMASYRRIFVIIDALDEYDVGNRSPFLEDMFRLQRHTQLNILAALRPIQEITATFEESRITLYVLEIRANEDDILRFLDRQMSHKPFFRKRPVVKEEIKTQIGQAAKGMFLLARLYLDAIPNHGSVTKVRDSVQNLPKGPDAYANLYASTMERIQHRKSCDLALPVLYWVAWAKRILTIQEIQHALAIHDGAAVTLDEDNRTDTEDIISACEGLITLDSKTNYVRLAHHTVREYLESVRHVHFPDVEGCIVRGCLDLLSSSCFKTGRCRTDAEFEDRLRTYPLYDYAARHWGYHAQSATAVDEPVLKFLQDETAVEAAAQCMLVYQCFSQSMPRSMTGLHLAGLFGLEVFADLLLSQGYDADARTTDGKSPLSMAAAGGLQCTVNALLALKVEVDSRDNYGRTPLSLAAEFGFREIVETLTDHGADADAEDIHHRSAISYAAESGEEAVVNYLLCRQSVQADRVECSGKTPLFQAADSEHWDVVRLLAAHGACLDTRGKDGMTPINLASRAGHEDALVDLIERGANVNLADAEGRTPLSYAAEKGHHSAVALILSSNADLNLADEDGWSPLIWASDSGWDVVVDMLLNSGRASVRHSDRYGQTALSIASRMGHKTVVGLLLDGDPDGTTIDMPDKTGWTPLIQAAKHGSREVMDLILDKGGAGVNTGWRDTTGQTALHWGAAQGNLEVVQRLIAAAVDVNATDNLGRTPLWRAAKNGQGAVVATLLTARGDADATDVLRRTPLQIAVQNGHHGVVEILLNSAALGVVTPAGRGSLLISSLAASVPLQRLLVEKGAVRDEDVLGLDDLFS